MPVTPIVTGDFQEFFYPMFEDGQATSSTSGVDIDAWSDITLLSDAIYRLTVTGLFTGTILTTMQLAFALGHTPDAFAISCSIPNGIASTVPENLNTPNTFTGNAVPLLAATVLPFHCEGVFRVQESQSSLTARFRSLLALNSVEILPGSVLRLQCLRVPQP